MGNGLDILIVNPNNKIVSPFSATEPPLWAGLIASHYKNQGQRIAILDAEAGDLTVEQTAEAIKNTNPRQVIIVVMGNNPSVSSTAKMLTTKRITESLDGTNVAVTGLHPLALPYETESELGVPVLKCEPYKSMPNIPWELLPMDKYKAHNWHCLDGSPRSPYAIVYTSLGCPFNCSFCNIHALYGGSHKVWYREPIEVIKEIDTLVTKYNVRNIKFWDELFTLNGKHIKYICLELIKRQYNLNIWAYARVDSPSISLNILKLMKLAGINWLSYGFESGNNNVLEASNKKASRAEAIKAVCMTHDAGINILGNFIFGLPGDTKETMQETLDFAKSLKIEYVNFYVAKAYPGSKIYEGNEDWASYNQFGKDNSEVSKFRNKAFIEFFTDPDYVYHIGNKFGEQAVRQTRAMLEFGKPVTRSG